MAAGRARARSAEAIRTRPARGDLLDDGLLDNGLLDDSVDMRSPVNGAAAIGGPAYRRPCRDSHPMRWGRRSLGSTERRATPMTPMTAIRNERPDPRLAAILRRAAIAGAGLVLALPAARGYNPWIGAMPLWLLAMPLASLWALHGFRLPRLAPASTRLSATPRRRRRPQARRRSQYPAASGALAASSRASAIGSAARRNS